MAIDRPAVTAEEQRLAAFEATLRSVDASLRSFVYRLVGADVDDVLQETYLAAYRALPTFRGDAAMSTWLHQVALRTASNHVRAGRRWSRWARREVRPGDDVAAGVAGRVDLLRALRSLSFEQRAVLLLVDGQGFSYGEAAQVLDTNAGTVASRLSRARESVRAMLDDRLDDRKVP